MAKRLYNFDCFLNSSLGGLWAFDKLKRFKVSDFEIFLWLVLFVGFWIKGNIFMVNILFSLEILFVSNSLHPKSQTFNRVTQRPDHYMKRIHALKSGGKFGRIIIRKPEIRRFQPINSTKLCGNSYTSTHIWSNPHRRAPCSHQSTLTPWASSDTSELIPWIEPSAPQVIVAVIDHGQLGHITFSKGNHAALF